eukprot:3430635-Rhodomonas_salina.1
MCMGEFRPDTEFSFSSLHFHLWETCGQFFELLEGFGLDYLKGSEFICSFYRFMGSRVGDNVSVWCEPFVEFDLFTFGDGTTLGESCMLQGHLINSTKLTHMHTEIGSGATLHTSSSILCGSTMEKDSALESSSLLISGEVIRSHEVWVGIPATPQAPV